MSTSGRKPIKLVVAKEQLQRINDLRESPIVLIGGLAVQQYVATRDSFDIDLVCSHEEGNEIVRSLYPTDDWIIKDRNQDEYRPEILIKHKVDKEMPVIRFGPKIIEREPYEHIEWNDLGAYGRPFQYVSTELENIICAAPETLCLMKMLSFLGRKRDQVAKIEQDLQDVVDLSNYPSFLLDRFYCLVRQWDATESISGAFLTATQKYPGRFEKSNLAKVGELVTAGKGTATNDESVSIQTFARPDDQYSEALENAESYYWLLGMSAEQFQRSVELRDLFRTRLDDGRPLQSLRFLLLHPDSTAFSARLREVNPDCDVDALIKNKRLSIKRLAAKLASLPRNSVGEYEVRLYDTYPIWLIQMYDLPANSSQHSHNRLEVFIHLAAQHSKKSPVYRLDAGPAPLRHSFVQYFDKLWESALAMGPDGSFPALYSGKPGGIRLIIFDFDGVVLESSAAKREVFAQVCREHRGKEDQALAHYDGSMGSPRRQHFERYLTDVLHETVDAEKLNRMSARFEELYADRRSGLQLVDGVQSFLERFGTKLRLAIVSNAPVGEVEELCAQLGIRDYFSTVHGHPTTKTEGIQRMLVALELPPNEAMLVGDTYEDRIAAEQKGLRFVGRRGDPRLEGYATLFDTFDEVGALIYQVETG